VTAGVIRPLRIDSFLPEELHEPLSSTELSGLLLSGTKKQET
jgi:hypothetical protein